MNIRLFFEISKDFFDLMYSLYIEEDNEEDDNKEKIINNEKIDEEKGLDQDNDEDLCYCDACSVCRQLFLVIDQNMYDNKID